MPDINTSDTQMSSSLDDLRTETLERARLDQSHLRLMHHESFSPNAVGARTCLVYEFTVFQCEHSRMTQVVDIAVEPLVMKLYAHCAYVSAVTVFPQDVTPERYSHNEL